MIGHEEPFFEFGKSELSIIFYLFQNEKKVEYLSKKDILIRKNKIYDKNVTRVYNIIIILYNKEKQ